MYRTSRFQSGPKFVAGATEARVPWSSHKFRQRFPFLCLHQHTHTPLPCNVRQEYEFHLDRSISWCLGLPWLCVCDSAQLSGCCQMLYKALFILYIQYFSVWFTPTKNLFHVFLPYKENKLVKREKWRVTSGESYGCGSKEQLECLKCGSFFHKAISFLYLRRTDTGCCCSQSTAPVHIPVRNTNSIPAESRVDDLHWCCPLSLMHTVRSNSASETLPVLKPITKATAIIVATNFITGQFWYFLIWTSNKPSACSHRWNDWHWGCLERKRLFV